MQTKIIATIGPKTIQSKKIEGLILAGADMLRFNFSHATNDQFIFGSQEIRKTAKKLKKKVCIIQDLQGPRIRVGKLPDEGIILKDGENVCFSASHNQQSDKVIPIDHKRLHQHVKKGQPFFLANGAIELQITGIKNEIIFCRIIKGGLLTSHKGINVPETNMKKGGLTPKDVKDVKFALANAVPDYIALSFVQSAEDIKILRKLIDKYSFVGAKPKIISKVERGIALKDIDRIIMESDAIMIARGDLGIEVPIENLPILQKNIVRHAHWHNTPAIIATQVLTSMITDSNPTRAEVSDISNAVFDRADALMLSEETAIGSYPNEAVKMLKKIIKRTEDYLGKKNFFDPLVNEGLVNKYSEDKL